MASHSHSALIVDDEVVMAQMLAEALGEMGWNASAATGLDEAVALFDSQSFSVVVSDVSMPDGDGFDLLQYVRSARTPVPVILMSSFGTRESKRRAQCRGAFAFLAKPFALSSLVALLEQALVG